MENPEETQDGEIQMNWKRIRFGLFGSFLGWLTIVLIFTLVLLFCPNIKWNVGMQAICLISMFVFGTLGHWLATARYNRMHKHDATN